MSFQQWLLARDIDCETLTSELLAALQSQYEADCQRCTPPTEALIASADCPSRVHRIVQPTLFDCAEVYQ